MVAISEEKQFCHFRAFLKLVDGVLLPARPFFPQCAIEAFDVCLLGHMALLSSGRG